MGSYREDCLERKAVQAGSIEQKPLKTRNGRPCPFIIEFKPNERSVVLAKSRDWHRWGAYRTNDEAIKAMQQMSRKYTFYDWRQKP